MPGHAANTRPRVPARPPRRTPSPRWVAGRLSSEDFQNVNSTTLAALGVQPSGAALHSIKLIDKKDSIRDVKIAIMTCEDSLKLVNSHRAATSRRASGEPGAKELEALRYASTCLGKINAAERAEDREHSEMPEMASVLAEIERGRRNGPLRQQQQSAQLRWQETMRRPSVASLNHPPTSISTLPQTSGSGSNFSAQSSPLLNPYSVVPQQMRMAALFGTQPNPIGPPTQAAQPRRMSLLSPELEPPSVAPPNYASVAACPLQYPHTASAPPVTESATSVNYTQYSSSQNMFGSYRQQQQLRLSGSRPQNTVGPANPGIRYEAL